MENSIRFKINSPKVIHETIDGETVMVNLDSGNYYSLEKVGADVWALIEKGFPVSEMTEEIAQRFAGEKDEMKRVIYQFVDELQSEGLIVTDGSPGNGREPEQESRDMVQAAEGRPEFEAPALHKYSDMQDLLLLDPIHEVDDAGWPSPKKDATVGDE